MKIFLGTDHAGLTLMEKIEGWLAEWGYEYENIDSFPGVPPHSDLDDYPDFIRPVAKKVAEDPENHKGIVLGGSGEGEAIVCNRYKGVRAAVYAARDLDLELVRLFREHNNSNVLSLGARLVPEEDAKQVIKTWLETPFPGEERHVRRIAKIDHE